MGIHQSTPEQPSFEEMLTKFLEPFTLQDVNSLCQYMQVMIEDHRFQKDPATILTNNTTNIGQIIGLLTKLETLATKEQRTAWFRRTFSRKHVG